MVGVLWLQHSQTLPNRVFIDLNFLERKFDIYQKFKKKKKELLKVYDL